MPKVIARGSVTQSKEDDGKLDATLTIYYCLCGEFVAVAQAKLEHLPRRPLDRSYALRNVGEKRVTYKLNTEQGKERMVRYPAGSIEGTEGEIFEYQRPLHCARCKLQIGYETVPGSLKGDTTFLLAGALTSAQGKIPEDAFETREELENEKESIDKVSEAEASVKVV